MTVRNWLTKLLRRSNKVEQAFFVTERDKGDYNNLHVHMLIGTNTDMSYQEVTWIRKCICRRLSTNHDSEQFVNM